MNPWLTLASPSPPLTPVHQSPPGHTMPPLLLGASALNQAASPDTPWLWQGFLARGSVTLLTSQWKAGKTTLASVLLARLQAGGTLAGRELTPARAIIVSEESAAHWARRHLQLHFGEHIGWFCRPFQGRPRPSEWRAFLDGLADLHSRFDFSLLIIDPLAAFLPGSENVPSAILEALLPLQRLAELDIALLVLHHPRKGDPPVGQAARGSGALSGLADIVIEMRALKGAAEDDRRRRLWASSRFAETPRQVVIEWSADGTDYQVLGSVAQEEFRPHWQRLYAVLRDAPYKLTRLQIQNAWDVDDRPDRLTLRRWLDQAIEQQLLKKDGLGVRGNPFRYWLPEREEAWRKDPMARLFMPEFDDRSSDG